MTVAVYFHEELLAYTALRPHFAFRRFGIAGDAVVAFLGPCDVRGDELVDLADRRAGETIVAALMLHFIIEHFGIPLGEAVWRQRFWAALCAEELNRLVAGGPVRREGDDLFVGESKLSVSIATISPTSALIHFGVNVDPTGAPVAAADLRRLGVNPREFASAVMTAYAREADGAAAATAKVRGVC